jgi:hypothetical protein
MPTIREATAKLVAVLPMTTARNCQMPGCARRAHVVVDWSIVGFGIASACYCDVHAPEDAIEA